jgi:hypothetical protein
MEAQLKQTDNSIVVSDRVERINLLHQELMGMVKMTVDIAIEIGGLLTQQKLECEHGTWLPWLKANVPFSQKTAWNYMSCYKNRVKLVTVTNLNLTLKEIYRLIDTPEETEPKASSKSKSQSDAPQSESKSKADAPQSESKSKADAPQQSEPSADRLAESLWNAIVNYAPDKEEEIARSVLNLILSKYPSMRQEIK